MVEKIIFGVGAPLNLIFLKVITHPNLVPQDEIQKIDKNGTL
jgi:hypothetical protein